MVNDTSTLMGSLREFGETLASNLETMGVSDVDSSIGLTYLANKILDVEPSVGGLGLTTSLTLTVSDNSIGYGDEYTLTSVLSASYDDTTESNVDLTGVITGASIVFMDSDENVLGSSVTNSNGIATLTLTSNLIDNTSITAYFNGTENFGKCESNSVNIIVPVSQYWYENNTEYSYTHTSSNSVYKLVDENMTWDLPSLCEIRFEIKTSVNANSGSEQRFFFLPKSRFSSSGQPYTDALYIQNTGGSIGSFGRRSSGSSYGWNSFNFPPNTYVPIKIVRTGANSIDVYANGNKVDYSSSFPISSYSDWTLSFCGWTQATEYVRNIVIEEL